MKALIKILFFSFCFITGLFSFPNLLAEENCISATGRISAYAYVINPVGIVNNNRNKPDQEPFALRLPEENTVIISSDNFLRSYSSDSTVSFISLTELVSNYQFQNKPCTLTIFFPSQ